MTYTLWDTDTQAYLKRFDPHGDGLLYMDESGGEAVKGDSFEMSELLKLIKAYHKKHNKSHMTDTFEVREF